MGCLCECDRVSWGVCVSVTGSHGVSMFQGGRRHPTVKLVGVSHSGLRLLAREKDLFEDDLRMVHHIR